MGVSVQWLHPILLIIFIFIFFQHNHLANSAHVDNNHLCPKKQSLALFRFKQTLAIHNSASTSCGFSRTLSYPKTNRWNLTSDCCKWDGVTCHELTGNVIGLDLSCSHLVGAIQSNSSLFELAYLERLDLSYNDLSLTAQIPHEFSRFAGTLKHLNLSASGFSGLVPSEIFHLNKLMSLNLEFNRLLMFEFEPQIFDTLFQNFTQLNELLLSGVAMNSVFPKNLSTSLTYLALDDTRLHGNLPEEVFHMPNLQTLILEENMELIVNLPKFKWNCSNTLETLDLSATGLTGELPYSIGYLKSLTYLYLGYCNLAGSIPKSIRKLSSLIAIDITHNRLEGSIPDVFHKLIHLENIFLRENHLNGSFPTSVTKLKELFQLDLANNSLTGPLPHNISGMQTLFILDLSLNSLNGAIPSWLFSLSLLVSIHLHSNRFTGELDNPIQQSILKLVNLEELDLSSNSLNGSVEIEAFSSLKNLMTLHLSDNNLSIRSSGTTTSNHSFTNLSSLRLSSCNIEEFPPIVNAMENLKLLDLSRNKIEGQIPHSMQSMRSLIVLNLQSNSIGGLLPSAICSFISLEILDLSHNNLSGEVPHCFGNFSSNLQVLDLSHNNLGGEILHSFSSNPIVLDLQMNHFHGMIPSISCDKLRSLNLYGNKLQGMVPRSLRECSRLQVLDLGNNQLKDKFPQWLENLAELQVLVLKSNSFHGSIDNVSEIEYPFPKLRILDLSNNDFTGMLPQKYLENFKGMMNVGESNSRQEYMGQGAYYYDSVTVVTKGVEIELKRILTVFTTIDLSKNQFEGEIPKAIGNLNSLRILNLSHNSLTGHIPSLLGSLSVLESLDLSSNKLVGEIPQQLTSLGFLEVLNLSYNQLTGHIPQGKQFDTFDNISYIGNSALCGKPLTKECNNSELNSIREATEEEDSDSDFVNGFTWEAVLMGYGCGTLLGFVIGYVMFMAGKPKWFTQIVGQQSQRHRRSRHKK